MGNTFRLCGREVWMPGEASSVMEERLRFVARLLDGEAMTDVCRDFGVSRKTGYKIFDRYKEHGLSALSDRSRRPVRYANQLPQQVESLIVRLKAEKPHWGARKIRELLVRRLGGDVRVPAKSTIHAVLDRHGLVKRGGGPPPPARGAPASPRARNAAVRGRHVQCPVVRRLQRRVQARQRAVLLPAARRRPCLAFPAPVRSLGVDQRRPRLYGLRTTGPGGRPAARDPLRQRRSLRQSQWLVQSLQALGLVGSPRHCGRTHQAGTTPAEPPSRAHAPHPQEGDNPPARLKQLAAAGPLRRLRARVQCRETA